MKKITVLCASLLAVFTASAQLNVDITTGMNGGPITPGSPDDTWLLWDGSNYVSPLVTTGYDSWNILHFPAPSNSCGQWLSPYVQASGTTYNGNPANSAQIHEYKMTFQNNAGCPLTNARIELNAVGADDYIYFKLNSSSTVYSVSPTISNCGGPANTNITVSYNINVPLNTGDFVTGTNTLYAYVCSDYKWTGFVVCGSVKADYLPDPNLVPTITGPSSFCSGSPITVAGSSATSNVTSHYWEIAECNSSGTITPGGYLWSNWYSNAPSGNFTFPNVPCGKFYKIKLALQNACTVWVETNKIISVLCSPTPVITGPSALCYGQTGSYCATGVSGRGLTYQWSTGATSSCINYTAVNNTTLTVTVTSSAGCSGSATYPITVYNTNPDFNVSTTFNSPYTVFNCTATPVVTTGLPPGFGYAWIVEEVGPPPTYTTVPNTTVNNPAIGCWWTMSCNFTGYNGTSTYPSSCPPGNPPGQFTACHYYRITRGTWSTNCGWQQNSKIVYMCNSNRTGNPVEITEDANAPSYEHLFEKQIAETAVAEMTIMPNPNNGNFAISTTAQTGIETIEIYNLLGEKISSQQGNGASQVTISQEGLAKGVYLVLVKSGDQMIKQRMIIE